MRVWINQDVDLPQALITAQRDGRLAVFAGAGVSMGPPSNLPSFGALATAIAAGVLEPTPGEGLDSFLGRLELHGIDVQARTRALIDIPTSTPRATHQLIASLFRDGDSVRLVTTNFDRHFTTVTRAEYPDGEIFVGPALPLGRELNGVVYLHGAVEKVRSRLVLTDADFGRAYLADGWATRFLMEMFREFTVLFIGYSHTDPVMRYLARSFIGPTARFALTPPGHEEFWTNLGITPVHFPLRSAPGEYAAIDEALQSWSTTATMGVLDHEARIIQLVATPPTPDPEAADYLRGVLRDPVTLRFFVKRARRPEWLSWVENEEALGPLVSAAPMTSEEGRLLAAWFSDHFAIQHPKEALDFVRRHVETLNPSLCEAIAFRLAYANPDPPAETLRLWAAALLAVPATPTNALNRLLRRCASAGDISTTALLFRTLIRPQLRFDQPWPGPDDQPLRLDVEMRLRGKKHDLREVWQSTILPNVPTLCRELLPTITAALSDASALLVAAGRAETKWDPMNFRRSAIAPHGQDHLAPDWGLLVDVARELLDWLLAASPALARATIDTWMAAPQPLLVRLAIYGVGRRQDLPPDEALALVEERGWLYTSSFKHEVFELLSRTFPQAKESAQRRLVDHSMTTNALTTETLEHDADARTTNTYEKYNLAVWLQRIAPESTVANEHLAQLQQEHPEFGPREHPDLDHWIGEAGFIAPNSPKTADELRAMTPAGATDYVTTYQPAVQTFRGPDREGLLSVFEQTAAGAVAWSQDVAAEFVARQSWLSDVWSALLGAWRSAELDDTAWASILSLLDAHPEIGEASPSGTSRLLERAGERRELGLDQIEQLEGLGERLLALADAEPPGVSSGGGIEWLTSAINHPGGQVVETWVKTLGRRITLAGDQWQGLPGPVRTRFDALVEGTGYSAVLGRIILASQVHFLMRADRAWTETHVVPLFDWDVDPVRAAQVWDGFLTWGRWSDPLVERMEPFIRQTFTRLDALGDDEPRLISALASVAAFSTADPWHNNGWLFDLMRLVDPEARAQWANEFGRCIESLKAEGIDALWNRWLDDYWQARLTGVPLPLGDVEKQAMVTWLPSLRSKIDTVINRLLQVTPSKLDHFTFYRLNESGLAQTHGPEVGRVLRGLLRELTAINFDSGEVAELANRAAEHGASQDDLVAIADDMARLACSGAATLRERARPSVNTPKEGF